MGLKAVSSLAFKRDGHRRAFQDNLHHAFFVLFNFRAFVVGFLGC